MERPLIYGKMSAVMKEIGFVGKDQKNAAQGFKFRGIDQFVNALYPALVKHGVFIAPREVRHASVIKDVVRSSGKAGLDKHVEISMEYDFFAEDGSKVTIGPIPGEGLDSGDKATTKALSAALKYALIQAFCVPTQDMSESDLESPEIVPTATTTTVKTETAPAAEKSAAQGPAPTPTNTVSPFRKTKPAAEKVATPEAPAVASGDDGWGT